MTVAFAHLGICVSDMDRSMRFYCEGLGFSPAESHTVGNEFGGLLELEGDVLLQSQFIDRDGVRIELLYFHSPGHERAARRPFNTLGLTHLSLLVDDVDEMATTIFGLGGEVLRETRTQLGPELDFVYCTDPDGTRIELMRLPSRR
jgi:catechol 2,3-dioxygenase-like lactoylglutathione lyase family enzyme